MSDPAGDQPVRTRIAPSPTGNCHVGTARSALFNLLFARQHNGTFVLRIEDTDTARSTPESEQGVLEGLRWLGLQWDEGPDIGGPHGPYRASERLHLYRPYADQLVQQEVAYRCYCTPEELAEEQRAAQRARRPPKYSGRCRNLTAAERGAKEAEGRNPRLMLKVRGGPVGFHDAVLGDLTEDSDLYGDFALLRSTGWPLYNFAVVVDDHLMAISHSLRGAEHTSNTFRQLLIYEALDWEPPQFGHLPLLLNPDRSKISKRQGAVYVGEFRDMGYLPEAMVNFLALLGWHPSDEQELFTLDELRHEFSLGRVGRSPAIFDDKKLEWLDGVWIRSLPLPDLVQRAQPFLVSAGLPVDTAPAEQVSGAIALEQERVRKLSELPDATSFFFADELDYDPAALVRKQRTAAETQAALTAAREAIAAAAWDEAALDRATRGVAETLGWRHGDLFMAVRLAMTGRTKAPPLFDTMLVIGRERLLARLDRAVRHLELLAAA